MITNIELLPTSFKSVQRMLLEIKSNDDMNSPKRHKWQRHYDAATWVNGSSRYWTRASACKQHAQIIIETRQIHSEEKSMFDMRSTSAVAM